MASHCINGTEPEAECSDTEWEQVDSESDPEPMFECEYGPDDPEGSWDIPTEREGQWDQEKLAMCYEIVADLPNLYAVARGQFRHFIIPQRGRKLAKIGLRWPTHSKERSDESASSVLRLYKALQ